MELIKALNWRYATKKMNGTSVADEKINQIIEVAHLAPSSSGLQPYEIFVISNPEIKKQIQPIACNQPQIVECSHLLVFASWDQYTDERIDHIFNHMNKERNLPNSETEAYVKGLKETLFALTKEQQAAHAGKQSYISFGLAIAQCALLGVDATPMEGFVNEDLDKFLKLDERGLKSQTMLAIGHRAEGGDWLVGLKKVRQPKEKFLHIIE